MLEKKYKNIVLFIGLTIVITIAIQFYWNAKIYAVNKQQLNNQIRVSFDTSIENYFTELAKRNVLTIVKSDSTFRPNRINLSNRDTIIKLRSHNWEDSANDNNEPILIEQTFDSTFITNNNIRSQNRSDTFSFHSIEPKTIKHISILEGEIDSLKFEDLTKRIIISFREDIINLNRLDSLFKEDLIQKNILLTHGFKFTSQNQTTKEISVKEYQVDNHENGYNTINSNPTFLPPNSNLQLLYIDNSFSILRSMLPSIFLSLLLSVIIIGCLLFLLKIIFKQKQLSDIKNDFISNITHEFKTPISTISVALEGFEKFDVLNDESKRNQYLSMSNEQLGKLNNMVEKLLEMATFKADQFEINLESVDLSNLVKKLVHKYQFSDSEKSISLSIQDNIKIELDAFHFENALNNIIDNAIKYGGNQIKISASAKGAFIEIDIEDNGNGIDEKYINKIFDQFYRVSTGDIHNVKGFGIGLYYTKNIIEKHHGKVFVSENKKGKVNFKIKLSNGN